jgi:hypothetical protein
MGEGMPVWEDARVDTVYYDERVADENAPCDVRIDGDQIVVSYEDEEGKVVYTGKSHGPGHYHLAAPERKGTATLHKFEGSKFLEGFWIEDGWKGFWRITLN